jgi:HK97 family phage prohead protease
MAFRVRGYASVFRNIDLGGEVVSPGAFSAWLKANPTKNLNIFWNHSHMYDPKAKPIGTTTRLHQDSTGLFFEGELNDTAEGLEVQKALALGRLEASFAFHVTEDEIKKSVRHIKSADPFEITAASFGMNPKAFIEAVPPDTSGESE